MNDMFVPGSHREQITQLGLIGIAMQDSQYETSNATYLRFEIEDTGNVYIYIYFFLQQFCNNARIAIANVIMHPREF